MRLSLVKSKNSIQFYIIESYRNASGKSTSRIIEKLGNLDEVIYKANGEDPYIWAKKYVDNLNHEEKEKTRKIIIEKSQTKLINNNENNFFNCGYLFLEQIYYQLGLNKICNAISKNYKFKYDLNSILSRLIYSRILYPSSKLATYEISKSYLEKSNFELQDIYRSLEIISENNNFIQKELYKNSINIIDRNTNILYYDCTNYFFELEEETGLKQYGMSKENRPNPIVQMGLFMDGNGIPLAFNINPGNTNEQITLKPLEEQIIKDFNLSKFIVCTDAGLSSINNRKFNSLQNRSFVVTQSIKKLKTTIKEWALNRNGWKLENSNQLYNLDEIESSYELKEKYKNTIFYKERWINENNLEQKIIITYSIKYKEYQKYIRNSQIERAKKAIQKNQTKLDKSSQNNYKRFISKTSITNDGEIANKKIYTLNESAINNEKRYDGYYGVCTNLESSVEEIININKRRWEIEESFRIMKSEFKARPVYLSKDCRIQAHFTTCFIALLIHRILEKKLKEKYTTEEIINTLRNMNLTKINNENYIPSYTRTKLTDELHKLTNFRTDYEIITKSTMKKIFKDNKTLLQN